MNFDYFEYTIASHLAPAIINADETGLDRYESRCLNNFLESVTADVEGLGVPVQGHFAVEDSETNFAHCEAIGCHADCVVIKYVFRRD
jgi:hypothetical protein